MTGQRFRVLCVSHQAQARLVGLLDVMCLSPPCAASTAAEERTAPCPQGKLRPELFIPRVTLALFSFALAHWEKSLSIFFLLLKPCVFHSRAVPAESHSCPAGSYLCPPAFTVAVSNIQGFNSTYTQAGCLEGSCATRVLLPPRKPFRLLEN